jgi:hypothetical protein
MSLLLRLFILLAFVSPQAFVAKAHAKPASAKEKKKKTDEDENEKEDDDDEAGEGDPYVRYEKSKFKNQNCDPTILENFYKKYGYLSCLVTNSGVCVSPTKDELSYALYGGFTGAGAGVTSGLAARKAARLELLRQADLAARNAAEAVSDATAGRTAAQIMKGAKPLLLAQTEKTAARTVGGIIVRNGTRGALLGFLGGGVLGVGILAVDISLTYGISATGCSETTETDPNFRKYVPLEKGTCHTPVYNAGAPQVLEFLKLPLEKKLKILDGNKRICGFYRSMNEEMDVQIAQLEGGRAIGSVTCDPATGDIKFKTRVNATRTMIIKRKPGTKEMTAFQYRDYITPNMATAGVDFELVKTEYGTDLSRIHILNHGLENSRRTIPYEKFPEETRNNPPQTRAILYAFRTTRTHAQQLMKCCDLTAEELAEPAHREECPIDWFPARKLPADPPMPRARPKTTQ